MGWIKELEDVAAKSKSMRNLIVSAIIIIMLAAGCLIFLGLKAAFQGKSVEIGPVKLPGSEKHQEPKYTTDSGVNLQKSFSEDTPNAKPHRSESTHKIKSDSKKGRTSKVLPSMKIDSGGSGIQNNAPNYGNQAGRDMTVNNYGNVPMTITEDDLKEFLLTFPNKSMRIGFVASHQDKEILSAKNQIIDILKKRGYTNIEEVNDIRIMIGVVIPSGPPADFYLIKNDLGGISFYFP